MKPNHQQVPTGFDRALEWMEKGRRVCRVEWNGEAILELQVPDAGSKMTQPYIYITTVTELGGSRVPWAASQTDLLAKDWAFSASIEEMESWSVIPL